jgi:hypothetical protein
MTPIGNLIYRCTGFVNIETTTNPIDRSIAHLLFHRPSESSTLPRSDTLPLKSTPMVCITELLNCLNASMN